MDKNVKYVFALFALAFLLSQFVPVETLGIDLNAITGNVVGRNCVTKNLATGYSFVLNKNEVKLNSVTSTGFQEFVIDLNVNGKSHQIKKSIGLLGSLETDTIAVYISAVRETANHSADVASMTICT